MTPVTFEVLDYTSLAGSVFGNLERFGITHHYSKNTLPMQALLLEAGLLTTNNLGLPTELTDLSHGPFHSCRSYFFEETRLRVQALGLERGTFLIPLGWLGHSLWCAVGSTLEHTVLRNYLRHPTDQRLSEAAGMLEGYFRALSASQMRPLNYCPALGYCHADIRL